MSNKSLTKSWIRRWMKRHGGKSWFKNGDQMVSLDIEAFDGLTPKEAVSWFDYEVNVGTPLERK